MDSSVNIRDCLSLLCLALLRTISFGSKRDVLASIDVRLDDRSGPLIIISLIAESSIEPRLSLLRLALLW